MPKPAELTPETVVARLQSRFEQIQDYECLLRTETSVGKKVEADTFRLWYRRPGLLRLRVLQGRRKGSELLLRADGTLRGRRGGWRRAFPRRLRRSDRSLYSLRGHLAWELDFGSFLRAMRKRLELPGSTAQVRPPTPAEPHLLLIVNYRPQGAARPLKDVWKIDSNRWLLLSGDVFDGETRVDHVEFADLKVDQGLSERWFRF